MTRITYTIGSSIGTVVVASDIDYISVMLEGEFMWVTDTSGRAIVLRASNVVMVQELESKDGDDSDS